MRRVIIVMLLLSNILSAELFKKRDLHMGIIIGRSYLETNTRNETQNYTIAGISANYFFIDNLSIGFEYKGWFGGTPTINQLTIPVTYYFSIERYMPSFRKMRPYLGVFVRENFVSNDYGNYESYAGKIGVALSVTQKTYFVIGWVKENYVTCPKWLDKCSSAYPEVVFSISF